MTEYVNRFRPSEAEIERRYANTRKAMEEHGLDYLIVSGSEYSGFEGAIRYLCGFHILHRYAYLIVSLHDDPICVFPPRSDLGGRSQRHLYRSARISLALR